MLLSTPFDDFIDLLTKLNSAEQALKEGELPDVGPWAASGRDSFHCLGEWLRPDRGSDSGLIEQAHICLFTSNYDHGNDQQHAVEFAEKAGRGQTLINEACKDRGIGLRVLEMAPAIPHSLEKDWPEKDCMAAVAFGMEASAAEGNLLGIATLAAGADVTVNQLITELEKFSDESEPLSSSSRSKEILECFRKHGGREIAAVVGALTAARSKQIPVLIEGEAAIAGLYLLWLLDKNSVDNVRVAVPSTARMNSICEKLGKRPVLNVDNTLEDGCGVAIAMSSLFTLGSIRYRGQ